MHTGEQAGCQSDAEGFAPGVRQMKKWQQQCCEHHLGCLRGRPAGEEDLAVRGKAEEISSDGFPQKVRLAESRICNFSEM